MSRHLPAMVFRVVLMLVPYLAAAQGCEAPAEGASARGRACASIALPRVVILGSSTAAGGGASSPAAAWAGRLAAELTARGFVAINKSISGTTTGDSLARFQSDVAPLNPAFVVLATSIVNEGLTDNNIPHVVAGYLRNTRQLVQMVEQLGAIPVIVSPYPNAAFSPRIRSALLQLSSDLEAEGVTVWDFWSSVDDGQGRWLPGLSNDGTHPTDAGHAQLFSSIPLSFFEAARGARPLPPSGRYGSWQMATTENIPASLSVVLASPAGSWTLAFWLKPDTSPGPHAVAAVQDAAIQVTTADAVISVLQHGQPLLAGPLSDGGFTHAAVTYSYQTGALRLYVNGVLADQAVIGPYGEAPSLLFGADSQAGVKSTSLSQLLVYRTPLPAADIADLYAGRIHTKSLEADLPLAQSPARRSLNRAFTLTEATATGSWIWTPASPPTFVP